MHGKVQSRPLAGVVCLALLLSVAAFSAQAASGAKNEAPSDRPSPVDLNQAGEQELIAVPGIGKVMAERIITWREQHGPFKRVEDLMKIRGIGEKSFQKLKPFFKVAKSSK